MQSTTTTAQHIFEQIETLPSDSLDELATYVDFLRFKARKAEDAEPAEKPLRVIKLRGLLKGYDFSPEVLAETRREMWRKYEDVEP
ncbi:MAG: hypothetical protein V9H69_02375 [Anaerolineae bacterium]